MKLRLLGVTAGLALLPMLAVAQTTSNPTPVTPPTNDSTAPKTTTTGKTETTTPPTDTMRTTTTPNPVVAPPINTNPTISPTPLTNPPTTTTTTEPVPTTTPVTPPTTDMTTGTVPTTTPTTTTVSPTPTTTTTMDMGSAATSSATVPGMITNSGSAPASGSAFAMGTHSAARDSLLGPRPEPPGDGTKCPWGCPTSKGVAGLTGPQFLALQQELRDRKCGNSHVTGRLDAATRIAIRNCAKKMGVANTAAAVLVGFDVGFSAADVGISDTGAVKQEE